jgi:hypothetical protein
MAVVLTVQAGYLVDNTQKKIIIEGRMVLGGSGNYPAGGVPLDSVLLALPEANTNSGVFSCLMWDESGVNSYIFTRIPSTGTMMILQVPVNGSLTTAAPLNQLPSSTNMSNIGSAIHFIAHFKRNA